MASQTLGAASPSNLLTIYGGVSTVTYTTTITASGVFIPAGITTISWPVPNTPEPAQYTSFAAPIDPSSKYFPSPLPDFTATFLEVVIVNTSGQPLATLVEVQAQPAYVYGAPLEGVAGSICNVSFYTCWSEGKKAGVIIAITLGGLFVLVFIIWLCCFMRISRSRVPDEEASHVLRSRDRGQRPSEGYDNRRKRVSRSTHNSDNIQDRNRTNRRHSSVPSRSYIEPPKPLPRVLGHIRSDAVSVSSAGAVVGVGERDTRRDAIFWPAEAFDSTTDRHPTRASTMATEIKMTTAANTAKISRTASRARDLEKPQRRLRRSSGQEKDVGQYERGRSPVRKHSSRKTHPRLQSYSPYRPDSLYRSDSPPTDNRNSFAPYVPLAVAVLEDLWKKVEQSPLRIAQRSSSVYSTDPQQRSQRRPCRKDSITSRQRRHSSQHDQLRRSRSVQHDVSMSGGLNESMAGGLPPVPRRSSQRPSNDI